MEHHRPAFLRLLAWSLIPVFGVSLGLAESTIIAPGATLQKLAGG